MQGSCTIFSVLRDKDLGNTLLNDIRVVLLRTNRWPIEAKSPDQCHVRPRGAGLDEL